MKWKKFIYIKKEKFLNNKWIKVNQKKSINKFLQIINFIYPTDCNLKDLNMAINSIVGLSLNKNKL